MRRVADGNFADMEKAKWKVEGMDCTTCALNIHRYLEKQGMKDVKVNFATGDVMFIADSAIPEEKLSKGIEGLGYKVMTKNEAHDHLHDHDEEGGFLKTHLQRFLFCLPFTLVLMLHMIPWVNQQHTGFFHFIMNPWVQLGLTIPVYIVGMSFYGKSAWKSIRNGMPNMNVLIALGATAAFFYSLYGTLTGQGHQFLFYETTATIITLVFLGNYLEDASIASTQRELKKLIRSQKLMANMIAFDDQHQEQIFEVENTQLRVGDLILVKSGEKIPIDAKILWGEAEVDEAIITGESVPVLKKAKDKIIGGSILQSGTVKAQVTAVGDDTVLSSIINLVRAAQGEKPPVQKMADRISAIFIPVVLGIAVVTLIGNWIVLGSFGDSLLRSIAVLVIACPCAMGLATPAAIAVGLGRAAKNGILFRNASSLEQFREIKNVVFDKTGTLTTGRFRISGHHTLNGISTEEFKKIVHSLEKYSTHPIARSIASEWKTPDELKWKSIEEVKGVGIKAEDPEGNTWWAGSHRVTNDEAGEHHNVYLTKNDKLLGWIDVQDEIRPESRELVNYLKGKGIRTILLSGDKLEKTKKLGDELGIETIVAEKTPQQKLQYLEDLTQQAPTAMVGDGINDAPALARATIGISMSDASHLAMQSAQVVLMNQGLKKLPTALGLGKHTYITIKQNLFWAFAYNVVAIPVAAFGFLTPTFGALVMGLSDVVLAINSVRLFVKKVV